MDGTFRVKITESICCFYGCLYICKNSTSQLESVLKTPELSEYTNMNGLNQIDIYKCLTTCKKSILYFSSFLRCSFLLIIMPTRFCEFEFPMQEYAIEILNFIWLYYYSGVFIASQKIAPLLQKECHSHNLQCLSLHCKKQYKTK